MAGLSFVTPLAYDWRYALDAIRSYYCIADEIILGLDRSLISWSGNRFKVDMAELGRGLRRIDMDRKIRLLRGDFHSHGAPMRNDTWERNWLSRKCRPGNWVVQIDSDEVLVNPREFREWLVRRTGGQTVNGRWELVFKVIGGTALVVDYRKSYIQVATMRRGGYVSARETTERRVVSPLVLLHYSLGRTAADLKQKLYNWSHSPDFDLPAYLKLWKSVTLRNYGRFRNFHFLYGPHYPRLRAVSLAGLRRAERGGVSELRRVLGYRLPGRFTWRLWDLRFALSFLKRKLLKALGLRRTG